MRLMDIVFPRKCVFCGEILTNADDGACLGCSRRVTYVTEPKCARCGKPISDPAREYCTDCERRRDASLDENAALWVYLEDTKRAMAGFKYGGCSSDSGYYAGQIAKYLSSRIATWNVDVIVPIPIHKKRERFRGYNQAELLARDVGGILGIPVENLLKRSEYTVPLKELDPEQRKRALSRAFEVSSDYDRYRHDKVLLIDDIYTTGATMEACSGLLKGAGSSAVYGVCLCIGSET